MSARTHSLPPAVEFDVEGPNRDLAVIIVDLERGGAIARSIVRDLVDARVDLLLSDAALYPSALEGYIDRILGAARPAFRIELTPDAATDLRDSLTTALDAAEVECASDGCSSVAVIDGHCAADDERLDTRRASATSGARVAEPIPYATVRRLVLSDMQAEVTAWCERKGWKGEGSAPVTFGDTMALLHSEVSEALEAFRDWGLADATAAMVPECLDGTVYEGNVCKHGTPLGECTAGSRLPKPEGVGSEFADVLIRLLDDCDRWGIDLAAEYERKMAYNETRAFQHGGRAL